MSFAGALFTVKDAHFNVQAHMLVQSSSSSRSVGSLLTRHRNDESSFSQFLEFDFDTLLEEWVQLMWLRMLWKSGLQFTKHDGHVLQKQLRLPHLTVPSGEAMLREEVCDRDVCLAKPQK